MSTRKITLFYALLIAVASLAVGMVIASRLDLTPSSSAQTIAVPPMNSAPLTGPLDAQTFRNIAKANTPMVVNIRTEMKAQGQNLNDFFGGGGNSPDDFFRRFFGGPDDQGGGQGGGNQRRPQTTRAAGTGFIINRDGFILTNNHVVESATKIQVSLFGDDERQYNAKLIGRDQLTDSALILLLDKPDHPLPEAKFGDSSQMAPGDWVMAIGNPFGYTYTVTVGVISATQRAFPVSDGRTNEVLQTDAAINPGNSGGPLLNVRGEVIGINSAIITNPQTEGNIGIGFAVPINAVRELLPQLQQGRVIRGRIGVSISAVPREGFEELGLKTRTGAIVAAVTPGGAAAKAGLEPGDIVLQFNGRPVTKTDELQKLVVGTKPGTSVSVRVLRNKQERTVNVTVEELDLAAEQNQRLGRNNAPDNSQPQEEQGAGFGLTLQNLTPQIARRLQVPSGQTGAVITDVDPDSSSAAAGLRPGDVLLSVNRVPVSNAAEAGRELKKIQSGRLAQLLLWRNGNEVFATVKKD
jgi:serine protease Do